MQSLAQQDSHQFSRGEFRELLNVREGEARKRHRLDLARRLADTRGSFRGLSCVSHSHIVAGATIL